MRLVMMGTGSFAEPTLEALLASSYPVVGLVTQPDRATGKERGSTRQARLGMKEIAVERAIPVLQPENINTPEGVASLKALSPDLLVVAAYGQILSRDVLASATHGGINVHASLLPKYRGAAPIAWAIYHGETTTGVSIIRMSISLDAGEVLAQETTEIGPDETAGDVERRLAPLGASLAVRVIERLAAGPLSGVPQDKGLVTKAPKLTKEHGLIDWSRQPRQVCDQIRAMQPWPTAYTYLHEKNRSPVRLMLQRAMAMQGDIALDPRPGATGAFAGRWYVRTGGEGAIEILELQPAGKRRMSANDFLRGHPLTADAWLGPEKP